jgi:hypothetical protein
MFDVGAVNDTSPDKSGFSTGDWYREKVNERIGVLTPYFQTATKLEHDKERKVNKLGL